MSDATSKVSFHEVILRGMEDELDAIVQGLPLRKRVKDLLWSSSRWGYDLAGGSAHDRLSHITQWSEALAEIGLGDVVVPPVIDVPHKAHIRLALLNESLLPMAIKVDMEAIISGKSLVQRVAAILNIGAGCGYTYRLANPPIA